MKKAGILALAAGLTAVLFGTAAVNASAANDTFSPTAAGTLSTTASAFTFSIPGTLTGFSGVYTLVGSGTVVAAFPTIDAVDLTTLTFGATSILPGDGSGSIAAYAGNLLKFQLGNAGNTVSFDAYTPSTVNLGGPVTTPLDVAPAPEAASGISFAAMLLLGGIALGIRRTKTNVA